MPNLSQDQYEFLTEIVQSAANQSKKKLSGYTQAAIEVGDFSVELLGSSGMQMTLESFCSHEQVAIIQSFMGNGIVGEILTSVYVSNDQLPLKGILKGGNSQDPYEAVQETCVAINTVCLNEIATELDAKLNFGTPRLLKSRQDLLNQIDLSSHSWKKVLVIKLGFILENQPVELMMVQSEASIERLFKRLTYLID